MLRPTLALAVLAAPLPTQVPTEPAARQAAWAQHQRMRRESPFRDLQWRSVGPAFQGGRIEAFACPPARADTIYLGVGSGGVFKTTDGGRSWKALFDEQPTTAIGSIAVAPSAPDTVWVGTGETHPSGTSFAGMGIFKSVDGGATWRDMGLSDSHHIARVVVDPKDPDTVHAGVMGHHRSRNAERGVFKTTDGGATWRRVLFVGDAAGVVDLVMDPRDPRTLFAATWDRRGPGSGIHKSTDGGATWTRLDAGLPAGKDTGRIGLDVSRSKPGVVYALVVDRRLSQGRRPGGAVVYRSDDGGGRFRRTHEAPLATWVGWDFCDVRVAPDDADRVFVCGTRLLISDDGGGTFARAPEEIRRMLPHAATVLHLDMHELWIDPADPKRVLLGTDGGLFVSTDRAQSWLHVNNLPIGEFYTVHADGAEPYRIWGGTQDNASLVGPAPWKHVFLDQWGGGDGFVTLPDPTDGDTVYFEHQNGGMRRKRLGGPLLSGRGDTSIRPRAGRGETPLDFAWNTPLLISRHAPRTLYCAAQRVLKSTDRGDTWKAISPDFSVRSVLSLSESPRARGLLYAALGRGQVRVTRDDGATWTDVSAGLPRETVTRVAASAHDEDVVYLSLSGVDQDEFDAHVFRSDDRGRTWRDVSAGLPKEPVFVVVEDPVCAGVIYAGTMAGVYVSLDRGATWAALGRGMPCVPVFDLAVQARARDLVAGTHGRSVFVLNVEKVHAAARR